MKTEKLSPINRKKLERAVDMLDAFIQREHDARERRNAVQDSIDRRLAEQRACAEAEAAYAAMNPHNAKKR